MSSWKNCIGLTWCHIVSTSKPFINSQFPEYLGGWSSRWVVIFSPPRRIEYLWMQAPSQVFKDGLSAPYAIVWQLDCTQTFNFVVQIPCRCNASYLRSECQDRMRDCQGRRKSCRSWLGIRTCIFLGRKTTPGLSFSSLSISGGRSKSWSFTCRKGRIY